MEERAINKADCWAYRFCGSCFSSALTENGTYSHEQKKASCETMRNNVMQSFKDFLTIIDSNPKAFEYLTIEDKPFNYTNMKTDE